MNKNNISEVTVREVLDMHIHNVDGLDRLTDWHKSFIVSAMNEYASRQVLEYAQQDDSSLQVQEQEKELTKMCMAISEKSLAKEWDDNPIQVQEQMKWVKYRERKPIKSGEYIVKFMDEYHTQKNIAYLEYDAEEGGFMVEDENYYKLEWLDDSPTPTVDELPEDENYPGKECGLSEYEWELEKVVLKIKREEILIGIGILHRLLQETKTFHHTPNQ